MIVSAQDEYVAGNDVTVTVTVENISANTSLQYVSALLYFDNTKLSPPDFSSGIHINVFSGFAEWEDLSVPVSDNCIRLTALTAGGNYGDTFTDATDDFDLMFEITFTALDSAKGNLDFQIPQAGISGCRVEVEDPYTKIEYIGKGSSAVIKERKITYDVPEDSEIKIEIDGDDSFESGTVVTVTELPSDDIPDSISVSLNDVSNKYVAFDFTATKDGESVQPSEPISVTLSIPADFTTNVSVYYISDNGERELIDAVIDAENRTITVVLEHFSNYVLVDNASMIGLRGDVTKNGEIDSRDYVFLKRAYFGTYKLDETATLLADVNNSGGLDSRDYVFLKRAYFGTYKIPDAVKYVYAE